MFNFFKKPEYSTPTVQPIELPQQPQKPAYAVGKTEDGSITLTLGNSTLTMTNEGCQQLIRVLDASIEDDEDDYEKS